MNDLLYYLVSSLVVLSLIFGIMCLVKLFKKELSKAYVVKRLKLFAGILAFIIFILYPILSVGQLVDFYSFPLVLRLCIGVDAVAAFALFVYLVIRWTNTKRVDSEWARIQSAIEMFFLYCPSTRCTCGELVQFVKDIYVRCKESDSMPLSTTSSSGRHYSAFVSDPIQFTLISIIHYAERYELTDLSIYAFSKLYLAEGIDRNRRLT